MPLRRRAAAILILGLLLALAAASHAVASTAQVAIFEDDFHLTYDADATFQRLRLLGVETLRVPVKWYTVAPNHDLRQRPPGFDATDPAAYPAGAWIAYDRIVKDAQRYGMQVMFDVMGGAPIWATGPSPPPGKLFYNWEPSPQQFRQFVKAVGTRYSGNYDPTVGQTVPGSPNDLPAVTSWSIWNEPDYGPSLAPQGLPGHLTVEYSPEQYRNLVDAAWSALHATGHGNDSILFGELAPRGMSYWGVFSGIKPLVFLRALYCVDSHYRQLRGAAARIRGCPRTAAGSRRFEAAHPALFKASGFSDHPYMRWYPPNREFPPDPDYSSLGDIGQLEHALNRLQRVYGSHVKFPIWDTEFGYLTSPPKHRDQYPWVTTQTAAYYLNWAEYIHWRDPRIQSFMQYLLNDPLPPSSASDSGGFASGLLTYGGKPKATYYAWRMPLYLPVTSAHRGRALEVWGCVRAAHFAQADTGLTQTADIQFAPGTSQQFTTIKTITISDPHGYFDVRVKFPGSGTVRVTWQHGFNGATGFFDPTPTNTMYSRHVSITLH